MVKKYLTKGKKKGGAKMNATAIRTVIGRGKKGDGKEGYVASCSLRTDKKAMRQIELAKNDIKAGRTRSLKDIIKNG